MGYDSRHSPEVVLLLSDGNDSGIVFGFLVGFGGLPFSFDDPLEGLVQNVIDILITNAQPLRDFATPKTLSRE